MSIVCNKYNSQCTVTTEFCARRHQKATFNPLDSGLEHCRTCEDGKKAFEEWKERFNTVPQAEPVKHTLFKTARIKQCPICGEKTHSKMCVKCKLEGKEKQESTEKTGGIIMSNRVTSSKVCVDCRQEYKPTSNVQKRCSVCIPIHQKKMVEQYKKNKAVKTSARSAGSQASQAGAARAINKGNSTQGKDIGPKVGRDSEPETYIISVDFSRYPKLHDRLLKMSDEDIRTPGDQLMFLIRNTLTNMEAQA